MTGDTTTNIHRYLDGVFANIPLTPEVQDLKEEIRGNLSARVAELEAAGSAPAAAARKAIREIGDVDGLIAQLGVATPKRPTTARRAPRPNAGAASAKRRAYAEASLAHHVKPRPGFTVRATLLSLLGAAGIAAWIVAIARRGDNGGVVSLGWIAAFLGVVFGLLVLDSLRQETTTNHPTPTGRALAYGFATALLFGGVPLIAAFPAFTSRTWMIVAGVSMFVAAIVLYAYLGASQTNRKKAWARALEADIAADAVVHSPTRLDEDPAAAARFGLYSGVLWICAIVAFIVLSITVGFAWSWLAFVGAILVQMILVASFVFPNGNDRK